MTLLVSSSFGPNYELSGTAGVPNEVTDLRVSTDDAQAVWWFRTDGTVDKDTSDDPAEQFRDGIEYTSEQDDPPDDLWIRATAQNDPDAPNLGAALDTWLKLVGAAESDREWGWEEAAIGTTEGSVLVELSTDSAGDQVVASGYYKGSAEVTA